MSNFGWLENEIRTKFDLRNLSREEERDVRLLLLFGWGAENQLRLFEEARRRDDYGASVVYFAQDVGDGRIKIGTSTSLNGRMYAIEREQKIKVSVLATMPGRYKVESWLHYRFADDRIAGEWFRPTSDLLTYIDDVRQRKTDPNRCLARRDDAPLGGSRCQEPVTHDTFLGLHCAHHAEVLRVDLRDPDTLCGSMAGRRQRTEEEIERLVVELPSRYRF